MKKRILYLALSFMVFTSVFTSCLGDLDTTPLDESMYTADKAYDSPEGYMQGLAKLYAALGLSGQDGASSSEIANTDAGTSAFIRVLWYLQQMPTDEVKWTQVGDAGTPELNYATFGTIHNPIISGLYYRLTFTVTLCNDFLKQTAMNKVLDRGHDAYWAQVQKARAEARLIRAMVYYYGLDVFGSMPFITEDDPIGSFFPKQITRKDLFAYIERELLELNDDPNLVAPRVNPYGRADKAAVWMLLSRLYLNADVYLSNVDGSGNVISRGEVRYADCKFFAAKVIDEGGYELCPNYAELFMGDNGENAKARGEMIYSIRFDGKWSQSYSPYFLVCGSRGANDNSFQKTSGVAKTNKGNRATLTFIRNSFWADVDDAIAAGGGKVVDPAPAFTWQAGDPMGFDFASIGTLGEQVRQNDNRAIFFTRQCQLPLSQNAGSSTFTFGWPSYKWTNITSKLSLPSYIDIDGVEKEFVDAPQYPSLDYPLMRLAEAYLNYAEACVRLTSGESSDAKAVGVLNELRDRAGVTAAGEEHLTSFNLEYIFGERSRELYWEGFRRTDLIRWNRFTGTSYQWEFKGNNNGPDPVSIPEFRLVYPIPESDLGVNPNLKQNPGYSKTL